MKNIRFTTISLNRKLLFGICIFTVSFAISCSTKQSVAHGVIEKYLKDRGAHEVTSDFFYTNANVPGKAYASVTATFNFANAQGKPQEEFLGFILIQESNGWKVEKQTGYTTEESKAALYLLNKKKL